MGKIKTVVVVIVLAVAGAAGALFGLSGMYQSQVQTLATVQLAGAAENALNEMRVLAFERIALLSRAARETPLAPPLAKSPATTGLTDEAATTALGPAHTELSPVAEELLKKYKLSRVMVVSAEGRLLAQAPEKDKFGESLKGLPVVAECLQNVPRDGLYEIAGKLTQFAAAPVLDDKGKPVGCLLVPEEIDLQFLQRINRRTGMDTAVILRQSVYLATGDSAKLADLATQPTGEETIWFGDAGPLPMFVKLERRGFAARTIPIPGGTEQLRLAVILPIGPMLLPLSEAHKTALFGAGALLVLGLLLAVFLPGGSDRQLKRLRDDITLMSNGDGSYVVDPVSYSGFVRELAAAVSNLAPARATRPPAARATPAAARETSPVEEPPRVSQSSPPPLDFESLLGGSTPAPASSPLPAPPAARPAPAAPPPSALDLLEEAAPAAPRPAEPAPSPFDQAGGGPRVNLPNDLANIFDEGDATREVAPVIPPLARPEPSRPPIKPAPPPGRPSFIPPSPPITSTPGVLDLSEEDQITSSDYRPDSTVIAQVPDELLRVSATKEAPEPPRAQVGLPRPPIGGAAASAEDAHFREVFEQFLKTKKQCNETLAGLTVDKFVEKLRKNAAELKARYNCQSVRFQVYVKAGRAALKATPVK
ncbi:MAG: hypothetical protein GYA21_09955 [Myxococcales bacterium]|nr:hypothetical protein [Myxococcales bacterium]